jgi:hypothetical protein
VRFVKNEMEIQDRRTIHFHKREMSDDVEFILRSFHHREMYYSKSVSLDNLNNVLSSLGSEELMNLNIGFVRFRFKGYIFRAEIIEPTYSREGVQMYKVFIYMSSVPMMKWE